MEKISTIQPQEPVESQPKTPVLTPEQKEILESSLSERIKSSLNNIKQKFEVLLKEPQVKKLLEEERYSELIGNLFSYPEELKQRVISEISIRIPNCKNILSIESVLRNIDMFVENPHFNIKAIYTNLIELNPKTIIDFRTIFKDSIVPQELCKVLIATQERSIVSLIPYFNKLDATQQSLIYHRLMINNTEGTIDREQKEDLINNLETLKTLYERVIEAKKPEIIARNKDLFLSIKSEEEINAILKSLKWREDFKIPNSKEIKNAQEELAMIQSLINSGRIKEVLDMLEKDIKFVKKSEIIIMLYESKEGLPYLTMSHQIERHVIGGNKDQIDKIIGILINTGELDQLLRRENLERLRERYDGYKLNLEDLGTKILNKGGYAFIGPIIDLFSENIKKRYEEEHTKFTYNPKNIQIGITEAKDSLNSSTSEKEKQQYQEIIEGLEYLANYEDKVRAELSESLGSDIVEHLLEQMKKRVDLESRKFAKLAMIEKITPIQAIGLFQSKINKLMEEELMPFISMSSHDLIAVLGDRFKSQHELPGNKRSKYAQERTLQDEFVLFGRNLSAAGVENAPIYGYTSNIDSGQTGRSGDINGISGVDSYGELSVRFRKDKVKGKSTMVFADSRGSDYDELITFFGLPHFAAFTSTLGYAPDSKIDREAQIAASGSSYIYTAYEDLQDPLFSINTRHYNRSRTHYSEVQFHNGTFPSDIEEIVVDVSREGYRTQSIDALRNAVNEFNKNNPNNQIRLRICKTDKKTNAVTWLE